MPDHDDLALLRRWPALRGRFARVALTALPTPVERLEVSRAADLPLRAPALWVKRDDLSGALYGGNKPRKLEWVLGEARVQGQTRLWTVGALGSHHAVATAIYGRELGFEEVHVRHFPQPITPHVVENVLAVAGAGAKMSLSADLPRLAAGIALDRARLGDGKTRFIPSGGSDPAGAMGYVSAAMELAEQVEQGALPMPAHLFVPVGSCGTFAGLWLGCKLAKLPTEVVGVRVVDRAVCNELVAARLIAQASAHLRAMLPTLPRHAPSPRELRFLHEHFGDGYGCGTWAGARASEWAAPLALDATYTAKAMAGALAFLRQGQARGPVLFWHTLSSRDLTPWASRATLAELPRAYQRLLG